MNGFRSADQFKKTLADFLDAHSWTLLHYTFKFQGYCWQTIEQYTSNPRNARIWQETARLREVVHRNRSDDPEFVGVLPVHYVIDDMVYCNKLRFYFLLRQRPCSPQNVRIWEETRNDLLNKARMLFVNSINLGIALRFVDGKESLAVLPGRYVRLNRRWTWEPLFTDWNEYLTGPGGIEEVDALLEPFTHSDESTRSIVPVIFDIIDAL
ncbi:hypothetical protein TRAPUB_12679 [Trametes pubescens]|uniref:Uncharacterized protein n=1 Tax=Trametes pubescens TaxID=154538 RepID=A0A1M2VTG5_TRAPU|nr:hypothetical protein TRAPUB_12679 [Trametes pubescens]